jgi:predicted transcriptional regulator
MKVGDLPGHGFKALALPDPDRSIDGVYIGDLLSWVMGRAQMDNAWITIMSNNNVIAVASLADCSCVLLAEGVELSEDLIDLANQKFINVLTSEKSAYEIAVLLNGLLS